MTHFTDRDVQAYIHHSLTDAQREAMNHHMQSCGDCHARLQTAEWQRRQFASELGSEIRRVRPSARMHFRAIKPGLGQRRRRAFVRFHSMQALSTLGALTSIFAFLFLGFYALGLSAVNNPTPAVNERATVSPALLKLFDEEWNDPSPYEAGLLTSQQDALTLLSTAPVYHIEITVRDDLRTIDGRQQIRFVNTTDDTLTDLIFHLYPNLGHESLVVYYAEVDGRLVAPRQLAQSRHLQIHLPRPLLPGETTVVEMAFEWRSEPARALPSEITHLAQFYPTLAVYRADSGWDMTLPTQNLLFAAAPSFYRVRVNAPASQHIIATGITAGHELSNGQQSGRQVVDIAAGPAHQFYLTMSHRWQTAVSSTVGETRLNSYAFTPSQLANAQTALALAQTALAQYNQLFGPYPYTELDIANVPTLANSYQGAAYPGVLVLEHDPFLYFADGREQMIYFQLASQWFIPPAAASQLQSPWLADGLAAYASHYAYGDDTAAVDKLTERWQNRSPAAYGPLNLPAAVYNNLSYYNMIQGQSPIFFAALAEAMGPQTFTTFLAEYSQTYRWGGADAVVFLELAATHCQCDLSPLLAPYSLP